MTIIERDKRCHQLLMLELRYDEKTKEYKGIYPENKQHIVSYDNIINYSDENWNKLIETIKVDSDKIIKT